LEFGVEDAGVVDDHALEELVELFAVDAVRAFHLPLRCGEAGLM